MKSAVILDENERRIELLVDSQGRYWLDARLDGYACFCELEIIEHDPMRIFAESLTKIRQGVINEASFKGMEGNGLDLSMDHLGHIMIEITARRYVHSNTYVFRALVEVDQTYLDSMIRELKSIKYD